MNMSEHAKARSQQRGIPIDNIEIILSYGTPIRKKGKATEYQFREKDAKRLIQKFDKLIGKAVVVSEDDTVITTYTINRQNQK